MLWEVLDYVFFEVVDEFEVDFNVFVEGEGKVRDEVVKVLDEIAEDGYLSLFFDEVDGGED